MSTSKEIADQLAQLGPTAFAEDRADALDQTEFQLVDDPFEGIACAGVPQLPADPTAFPVVMVLASNGHRGWAYPRDEFVVAVVSDLDRRGVHVGLPFFDPKSLEHPYGDGQPPPEPVGTDAESRLVDVQRVDLMEVVERPWTPGHYRVWLLYHDWCSNPCDIEISGPPTTGSVRPVTPDPTSGAVTFVPPPAPTAPTAPGIALQLDGQPGSLRLLAALHVEAQAVHLADPGLTVTESDGRPVPVAAVLPTTLILTSATGGAPQVLRVGVAVYGSPPQPGAAIHAGFSLEVDKVFALGDDEHLLWAWVEGVLHGPIAVP